MAVAQKRLPLRCILCRAKVLKIRQNQRQEAGEITATEPGDPLPKSVSGYNINNNISCSGSNYSFTSGDWSSYPPLVPSFAQHFMLTGVSAVSSESTSSRKCSLTRDFSFSSLSNFQNVNLLDKSQIPRSKVDMLNSNSLLRQFLVQSSSFGSRRVRRSRSPSPKGGGRSRSVEGAAPPAIRVERAPSEESLCPSPSSPLGPPLSPSEPAGLASSSREDPRFCRSGPRSPASPPGTSCGEDRVYGGRASARLGLTTPLSPIKESRKETESLLEWTNEPTIKENKIELAAVPKKQSSRVRLEDLI